MFSQNWPSQEEMNWSCAFDLERIQKIDLIAALTCLKSPLLLLTEEKDQWQTPYPIIASKEIKIK